MANQLMENWNNNKIEYCMSSSREVNKRVRIIQDPFENLIRGNCKPWPPIEIIQKLYKNRWNYCTSLNYNCDLQSIHSEDAITWSVFGTLAYSKMVYRESWCNELFKLLNIEGNTTNATISLWRRVPHPDTLVSGGPENDFTIMTDDTLILGEAKWRSKVANNQGKKKNKDQIQLRGEFAEKFKEVLNKNILVLGIGIKTNSFIDNTPNNVQFIQTTWDQICSIKSHPNYTEVMRYYKWKMDNI